MNEAIEKIKELMTQQKWADAHRACLEILQIDPDNLKVIRLAAKIERTVKDLNAKAIKNDLETLEPLWKEHRYEELLQNLKQLEPYIKDYPPLKKIILKAQAGYQKSITSQQKDYFHEEKKRIEELAKEKKYQEAVRYAEKLRILKIHENELKKLIKGIKAQWVNEEIEKNRPLLESEKYEDILMYLQHLKSIDSHSEKIGKMVAGIKKRYELHKLDQKKDFIYQGLEKIHTLYQLKKYDKAAEGAEEILGVDPKNTAAWKVRNKSQKKEKKRLEKELIREMENSHNHMKEDRSKNSADYISM